MLGEKERRGFAYCRISESVTHFQYIQTVEQCASSVTHAYLEVWIITWTTKLGLGKAGDRESTPKFVDGKNISEALFSSRRLEDINITGGEVEKAGSTFRVTGRVTNNHVIRIWTPAPKR